MEVLELVFAYIRILASPDGVSLDRCSVPGAHRVSLDECAALMLIGDSHLPCTADCVCPLWHKFNDPRYSVMLSHNLHTCSCSSHKNQETAQQSVLHIS